MSEETVTINNNGSSSETATETSNPIRRKSNSSTRKYKGPRKPSRRYQQPMHHSEIDLQHMESSHQDDSLQQESAHNHNGPKVSIDTFSLQKLSSPELHSLVKQHHLPIQQHSNRSQLIFEIMRYYASLPNHEVHINGTLDILHDGYGLLRLACYHYAPSAEDIYVPSSLIKKLDLRKGDTISGIARAPKEKEKFFSLIHVNERNYSPLDYSVWRPYFEDGVPTHPNERIFLETTPDNYIGRVIDIIAPIGKGTRGLIIAPPKTGKTAILKSIALSIRKNNPEIYLIILLIDERPEEVSDMQKDVDAEIIAATFDEQPERQISIAEMVMEKAKRLTEEGRDVCILLDSITRLGRAYNAAQPHSGKVLSGGMDAQALHKPKRLFGLARNLSKGSITIIATALSETGSRMDEVVYEEIKGTGNWDLTLVRLLAERRMYPAIDIDKSSTRQEERLLCPDELERCIFLRQELAKYNAVEKISMLLPRLKNTKTNVEFLLTINRPSSNF